jgi:predicted DNA binding CopG/RHH family protein
MENNSKNVKISEKHHEMLKKHCEKNGLKIHKFIEKLIDANCQPKKTDIYDED